MENRVPIGWKLSTIAKCSTPAKTLAPSKVPEDEFTYIDISAIDRDRNLIAQPTVITGKQAPSRARKQVDTGSILFATTRPSLKNIAIVEKLYHNPIASTGFCVLNPVSDIVGKYLYYYLLSENIQEQILPFIRGAQYPAISDKNLLSCTIPVPPLLEQTKIVFKLDYLFNRINKATALLDENINNMQHLMASVVNDVFTSLFQQYGHQPLHSCSTLKNGYAFKSGDFNTDRKGLQVIRIGNVLNLAKNPVYMLEKDEYKKSKLDIGDIIISMTGTRGKRDYLFVSIIRENKFYLNQRVGAITPNNNTTSDFLYYYLKSDLFRDKIFEFETGTVNQGNISGKDIMNSLIPLPTIDIQKNIVKYLSSFCEKHELLLKEQKDRLHAFRALKASILDAAFKGELSNHSWEALSEQPAFVEH